MSGIDEQSSEFPNCPQCGKLRFWLGEIKGVSVLKHRLIYFNHESFRGTVDKLKKIAMYDIKVEGEHGRYATEEEISGCFGIHCTKCKYMAADDIISSIKMFAINYVRRGNH